MSLVKGLRVQVLRENSFCKKVYQITVHKTYDHTVSLVLYPRASQRYAGVEKVVGSVGIMMFGCRRCVLHSWPA